MTQSGGGAIDEGAVVRAVFPHMAGKRRPGVVAHAARRTAAPDHGERPGAVLIIAPATTRRTNQPMRVPLTFDGEEDEGEDDDGARAAQRPSWLLPVMAAVFVDGAELVSRPGALDGGDRTASSICADGRRASAETRAQLRAALEAIFGSKWREADWAHRDVRRPTLLRAPEGGLGGKRLARARRRGLPPSPGGRAD